jgi:lipoteichoic acid synthase
MATRNQQTNFNAARRTSFHRAYGFLARHAHSVIIFGALFCTLAVKLFHALRTGLVGEYLGWISADVAVLLMTEIILSLVCFRWPRRWILRTAAVVAALACTWSVINAAWLIRTGTQVLPAVLLSLFRDPLNTLGMVGINLVKMPAAAAVLLAPSAAALAFFLSVLAKPRHTQYNNRVFIARMALSLLVVVTACAACGATHNRGSGQMASMGLHYNCQLRAIMNFFLPDSGRLTRHDLDEAKRRIPAHDEVRLERLPRMQRKNHNVVIVILEGIQYRYTSLANTSDDLTPHLSALAGHGVEFSNTRSSLTHTTKALFALLTGRYPSVSHDIVETVPSANPYASLATILNQQLNFQTAFFQSAKGTFESRPGLVYNLGYDKFWAREDLNDPNAHIGYLAADEFAILKPITEWIRTLKGGFLLTILCSVSHDPYEVPEWFATPAKEPLGRYRQVVSYTDRFIAALDGQLAEMGLADNTILCVIGDHGEAFGEHGQMGHERIGFDEALKVPFVFRAPSLAEPGTKITAPASSVDLTPTLLALLGFDVAAADFDGNDALSQLPADRKVYFSGWIEQSTAGFIRDTYKFIYNPSDKKVFVYDLSTDPDELLQMEPPDDDKAQIAQEIIEWRKNSLFWPPQERSGQKILFGSWLCRWNNRTGLSKYSQEETNPAQKTISQTRKFEGRH